VGRNRFGGAASGRESAAYDPRVAGWRFIEVSYSIELGMKTYAGLPEPRAETLAHTGSCSARAFPSL
jgi:hypothetical protein